VYAPVETSNEVEDNLGEIGSKVASGLKLNGLTDVQALLRNSNPRVNEINARLPSQTPSVVCHSANVNMVELLVKLFVEDKLEQVKVTTSSAVVLQHVIVCGNTLIVQGEHVMTDARDLRVERSFLGADEAITNIRTCRGSTRSVATLIAKAPDLRAARKKMNGVVRNIMSEFGLKRFSDPSPTKGGFAV
jgi:pyrrolysine biosynthesis protein PylC